MRFGIRRRTSVLVTPSQVNYSDFWDKMLMSSDIRLVVLAMPHHAGNLFALKQLRSRDFPGKITAIVEYPEEIEPIRKLGAHAVHHVYDEAGRALAIVPQKRLD